MGFLKRYGPGQEGSGPRKVATSLTRDSIGLATQEGRNLQLIIVDGPRRRRQAN
jgi:hypothetical protein